jgi:hypothetical protein
VKRLAKGIDEHLGRFGEIPFLVPGKTRNEIERLGQWTAEDIGLFADDLLDEEGDSHPLFDQFHDRFDLIRGKNDKKNSGIGREEGMDEILSYTECKTINVMLD